MCAYKPKRKGGGGPSGQAKIKFSGNKLGVWFSPDLKDKEYADKKYTVSEYPDWVTPSVGDIPEWIVRMDGDKSKVYSMYPYRGVGFKAKVQGIAAKENQPPMPKENSYTYNGQLITYSSFTVLLEITEGPAKGAVVPYTLRYNFGPDEEGTVAYTNWGQNSKHSPILDEFLTLSGAWDAGPIKFTDNILPVLQKRMLRAAKELVFQIKDGWIVSDSLDIVGGASWDERDADAELWDEDREDTTPEPVFEETDAFAPEVESDEEPTWDDDDPSDETLGDDQFDWDE